MIILTKRHYSGTFTQVHSFSSWLYRFFNDRFKRTGKNRSYRLIAAQSTLRKRPAFKTAGSAATETDLAMANKRNCSKGCKNKQDMTELAPSGTCQVHMI